MTNNSASISMWMTLVPVVVGGMIGLAGGLLGPWFIERKREATEKGRMLAAKFEELVSAVYEFEHWMDSVQNLQLYTARNELVPPLPASPFAKLHAISNVYFPEFEAEVLNLEHASITYKVWLAQARRKNINGEANYTSGFDETYGSFLSATKKLLSGLQDFAKLHFQKR